VQLGKVEIDNLAVNRLRVIETVEDSDEPAESG